MCFLCYFSDYKSYRVVRPRLIQEISDAIGWFELSSQEPEPDAAHGNGEKQKREKKKASASSTNEVFVPSAQLQQRREMLTNAIESVTKRDEHDYFGLKIAAGLRGIQLVSIREEAEIALMTELARFKNRDRACNDCIEVHEPPRKKRKQRGRSEASQDSMSTISSQFIEEEIDLNSI